MALGNSTLASVPAALTRSASEDSSSLARSVSEGSSCAPAPGPLARRASEGSSSVLLTRRPAASRRPALRACSYASFFLIASLMASVAQAQVDTPSARAARAALGELHATYDRLPEWHRWLRQPALLEMEYE